MLTKMKTIALSAMIAGGDWDPETAREVFSRIQRREPFIACRAAAGGRLIRDEGQPLPDGGWVITAIDITTSESKPPATLTDSRSKPSTTKPSLS